MTENRLSHLVDKLQSITGDPTQGLPEELFVYTSQITPLVNVDLLIKNDFNAVLDHGADRGQMFTAGAIHAKRRPFYEISGVMPEQDVQNVTNERMSDTSWDCILSWYSLQQFRTHPFE